MKYVFLIVGSEYSELPNKQGNQNKRVWSEDFVFICYMKKEMWWKGL